MNNLRIDGIEERPNETWEGCEASVEDILNEKLGIFADIKFERCHRMPHRQSFAKKPSLMINRRL